ncbi:hypothetical protein COW46_02265 [Candidatus Gracilibacteria bacterium CG17_big_fil_post_rev_8_21_14_2_50_48_13]|nr:MAG: hypothetical protein COW46_02265 [Candidatus Gracilibacteria bacterium CG17_big_fil_post_rev_8_21_14_2_50_48_13]
MADESREIFAERRFKFEQQYGKRVFGISIQIPLPSHIQELIKSLQTELLALEPNHLVLQEPAAAHMTVIPVVLWKGAYDRPNEDIWNEIAEECLHTFREMGKSFAPIQIHFRQVIANQSAVFLCAYDDNDLFHDMRQKLFSTLPIPNGTPNKNTVIHSVITRYAQPLEHPDAILQWTENKVLDVPMTIDRVELRKELQYPALKTEVLAAWG